MLAYSIPCILTDILQSRDALQTACWGRPPLLRSRDYDVRGLELDDFEPETPRAQALCFIETTKLSVILARISEIMSSEGPTSSAMARIDIALTDWVANVPEEIRLFSADGRRLPYHRPSSELYILYFVAIILALMPRHPVGSRRMQQPPILSSCAALAASCAVSLYDEVNCHDDAVGLLPFHGFFCLAVSLPLICTRPTRPEDTSERQSKLGVLQSVVSAIRDGYGDAQAVLNKMDWLLKKTDSYEAVNNGNLVPPLRGRDPTVAYGILLPFPCSLCRDLDRVESISVAPVQDETPALEPMEGLDDIILDYSLMDFFDFDFGSMDVGGEEDTLQMSPTLMG